jgi:uncharacterized protein with HEPN domain
VIRDPRLYLDDILESIDAIEEYTANLDEDAFRSARLVQDAVLRRLQIIGEAVKRLPAELRDKYATVPWRQMAATRDVVFTIIRAWTSGSHGPSPRVSFRP